jgi:hypothetical protein
MYTKYKFNKWWKYPSATFSPLLQNDFHVIWMVQPDSPVARPQRNRRPPQYLSDYVTSKQAITQPEWMMKVNWLKQEAKDGKFKGLEMELP